MQIDAESVIKKVGEMGLIELVRPIGDWYQCRCPIHSGGQEKKPSCGISLRDQYHGDKKTPALFVHCFRGDTEVITYNGIKSIAELCDVPDTKIINGNGDWETTTFHNYGNAQLWKITLYRDQVYKTIYATKNHEWFINKSDKTYTTEHLPIGRYLQSYIQSAKSFTLDIDGVIHGIVYGDGTRTNCYAHQTIDGKLVADKNHPISVSYQIKIPKFLKKCALVHYFEHNDMWSIKDAKFFDKDYYYVWSKQFPISHNFKQPPTLDASRDYLMSFLAGYFACDGSIDLMKFYSARVDELKKIQDICVHCDLSTIDVSVMTHDTNYLKGATLASLKLYPNSAPEEFYLLDKPKSVKYSRSRWRILSVEPTEQYEDVYCCETSTQSFVLGGNILTHNCFSCGLAKPLPEVLTEVLKNKGISKSGLDWLKENVLGFDAEDVDFEYLISQDISTTLINKYAIADIQTQLNKSQITYVSEKELASYRMTVPYMYQRGLTDEIIEKYDIGYDANFIPPGRKKPMPCITFPVKDQQGRTLFLCRRSIEGKFFHYPQGVEKSLYGLYELPSGVKSIVVAESCFNALTATKYGYAAVALLGTGTSYEIEQLKQLGVQEFVLCLDGDDAGQRGAAKLKKALSRVAIVWSIKMPIDKDINDCTKEEFDLLYSTRE